MTLFEGPRKSGPSCIELQPIPATLSIIRIAAGAFGFLTFNHAFDGTG